MEDQWLQNAARPTGTDLLPHQPLAVAKPPISWGTCTCGVAPIFQGETDRLARNLRTDIKLTVLGGGEG